MRLISVLFLAAMAAGCGGSMSESDAVRSSVSDAIGEDQVYLGSARAAATMPDMLVAVDHHVTRMDAIMGDMTDEIGSMHCMGMKSMMGVRDDMQAEMTAHVAAMHAMSNVPAALTEVERHVATMHAMMDDIDGMLGGMHCN